MQLGINENLKLTEVKIEEFKGKKDESKIFKSMVLFFSDNSNTGIKKESMSLFDLLESSEEIITGAEGSKITRFFPSVPMLKDFSGKDLTKLERFNTILNDIIELKNLMIQLYKCYSNEVPKFKDLFDGTDIDKKNEDDLKDKLLQPIYIDTICTSLMNQFMSQINPLLATSNELIRILLVRPSKAKASYGLRNKYLVSYPCVESMNVNPTKLKFTDYELKEGLNIAIKLDEKVQSTDILSMPALSEQVDFSI